VPIVRNLVATFGAAIGFFLLSERPADALTIPGEGLVTNSLNDAAGSAFDAAAHGVVTWVLDSVSYFTGGVVNFLNTASSPGVDSVWFSGPNSPYASVRSIALTLLLGFFLLGLLSGLVHGDANGMIRRMIGSVPAAIAGMVLAPQVTSLLLNLTDSLSTNVLSNSGTDALNFISTFSAAVNVGTGGFGTLIIAIFAILSALLLWIELLLRSALVYFLIALSPLAFAAMVWPAAKGALRRLMELVVAAIFSKLVICIALSVGAAALGTAGHAAGPNAGVGTAAAAGIGSLVTGTTLLVLASWAPFLLMRMMPVIETAVVAQGISRGPMRAAASGASMVSSVSTVARVAGSANNTARASTNASRIANKGSEAA
jgi:type IV secretion system protein TrbL